MLVSAYLPDFTVHCGILVSAYLPVICYIMKKAYDFVRTEVLCNILIEFGMTVKLVRLVKTCQNKICNKVRIGRRSIHLLFSTV